MEGNVHSNRNMFSPMEDKNPEEVNRDLKSPGHSTGKLDAREITWK
jgi:hypothetical protein